MKAKEYSMKIKELHIRRKLIIGLSVLFGFLSNACLDDNENVNDSDNDSWMVTFSVKVPGSSTPKTYALSTEEENAVKTIEVLLFDTNGNYVFQPIFSNVIKTDIDDSNIKTFTIKVPEGTYNMVILANARQSLNSILSSINTGDHKASVLEKLIISNNGKWNTYGESGGYISIPMFGEISSITVNANTPINTPVNLVRMISKIDVALIGTAATDNFKLENIRLYNYNNRGFIAPTEANWNQAQSIVTGPSIPSTASLTQGPLLYDGISITTPDVASIGEIYTFEAVKANPASLSNATCLVIGGKYTGDSQTTYYRVDFARTSPSTTYLPLLRNHYYKVNITKVIRSGFSTPAEAFNSAPVNIEANVITWNNAKITDIVFDGQYMLGVSHSEITFTRYQRTTSSTDNTFSIITDYPSGWKIDKIVDTGNTPVTWLSVVSMSGTPVTSGTSGSVTDLKLNMSENTSGSPRIAYIHFSAGRLVYTVKVTQNSEQILSLNITNTSNIAIPELVFVSTADVQPASQQFKIKWNPASLSVTANRTDINSIGFSFDGSSDQPGSGSLSVITESSGEKTFTIRPTIISSADFLSNPFFEKVSVVDFKIDNGITSLSQSIFLRQLRYSIITEKDTYYLMDGTQKYFTVKSNTNFTVEIKSNPSNVIQSLTTTSAPANTSGTRVYFNIIDDVTNPTIFSQNVVLTIKSPQGRFPDTDVTLLCYAGVIKNASNSYIVNPGGTGILIPVSRANESALGTQLGASESFTVRLVWTDNANRIAANSNIRAIQAIGTGSSGYVFVKPGSAQGNAIVEIKNSSNLTLWSWHIWVTSYLPTPVDAGKFMDRNLGATSNTVGALSTRGLLYQWGRKDPFPGSASITESTEPTLYTSSSTVAITKTAVPLASNLANSIANPTTFYHGGANLNRDWYTTDAGPQNNALWGQSAAKTVYDPCPEGWRVPQQGIWGLLSPFAIGLNSTSWNNNGMTWTGYAGWYPGAGYRNDLSGNLTNVGTGGLYWTASSSGIYSSNLSFNSNTNIVSVTYSTYRAGGFSIRCVSTQ